MLSGWIDCSILGFLIVCGVVFTTNLLTVDAVFMLLFDLIVRIPSTNEIGFLVFFIAVILDL